MAFGAAFFAPWLRGKAPADAANGRGAVPDYTVVLLQRLAGKTDTNQSC